MNILLTGASGFVGRNIASALVAAGHQVQAVSRSAGIDFATMLAPSDWLPHLDGIDAVINCVGIISESGTQRFSALHSQAPIALFQACAEAGISRVVQISALGADDSAFSAYHLSKLAADDCLRGLPLNWVVLRPSLIYGQGGKSAELFMRLAALPVIPLVGDGCQQVQPVHISDVVAAALQALACAKARLTIDVVGSEKITFSEWLRWMRRAQSRSPARFIHVPLKLVLLGAVVGRYINPIMQPENLRMLETARWTDVQPLADFLGRMPQRIAPSLFFSDVVSARIAS